MKEEADVIAEGASTCVDLGSVYVCSDTFVWVKASKRYFLFKHENLGGYPAAKLKAVVDNKWAELGVLFDGAFDCVLAGKFSSPSLSFRFRILPLPFSSRF